ncbi:uncharacterized protein LOC143416099 [Maylandia zebra]|uniref:uncharacterized protein LOC143416099 n=1 Tax=Maylandia zebra TaxID=106582 RepID=UPI00403CFB8A
MAAVELALEERVSLLYLLWRAEQQRKRRPRRTWVHQVLQAREQFGEFHHLLQELRLDDGRFQRYHRLSPGQFEDLLSRVGPRIARLDTNYRRSIPPAERLSVCLRFLATGDSFRTIAFSFRVGVSTVSQIIPQVATAIWDCLVDDFMAVPSTEDWRSIAECVKATCVLHNFLRCVDERGAPAVRGVAPAVVEPLQGLGRVAANNSSREAVLVREKFMAHFSAEGAVSWQPKE